MAWLPMYLTPEDVRTLLDLLNNDPAIAWLLTDGEPGRWRAHLGVKNIEAGKYCLWHVPSGPLPLIAPRAPGPIAPLEDRRRRFEYIKNPWMGWKERVVCWDDRIPYFEDVPETFSLVLAPSASREDEVCGMSSFGWIGNYYGAIGGMATPAASKWWKQLRRQVGKISVRIPRGGLGDPGGNEIYAFPNAYSLLEAGGRASMNPTP